MTLKEALSQFCLFAFNIDDFVVFKAVVRAIKEMAKPAIIQVSEGEAESWGLERFATLAKAEKDNGLPIFLNLDHGKNLETVEQAISLGFDMVHFDGSDLTWEENIEKSKQFIELAHSKNILVEVEPQADNSDSLKIKEFIDVVDADLIVVFVGNKHGMDVNNPEKLDLKRLELIKNVVGEQKFLTLHGGSGVPKEDLRQVITQKLISKININTQLRLIYLNKLKEELFLAKTEKIYELEKPIEEQIYLSVKTILTI